MTKPGRNSLCPCGSGKKYKKCHGPGELKNDAVITQRPLSQRLPLGGLHGLQQHLTVVPLYEDPSDPRNSDGPQGRPGKYEVVFTFSRPGYSITKEYSALASEFLQGDSHLAITKPSNTLVDPSVTACRFDVSLDMTTVSFVGIPNTAGFLSKITGRMDADSFVDAHRKTTSSITPLLSNLSAQLDIPLFIFQTDLTEISSGARRITCAVPFRQTPLVHLPAAGLEPDFRGYASLYRESLNSNSPVYQFLCFFKIIQSIQVRRKRLAEEARSQGSVPERSREVFPATVDELKLWLDALYPVRPPTWDDVVIKSLLIPETSGRKFGWIIENYISPFRNQIAHAFFDTGELALSTDDPLSSEKVNKWLPILKCIVRRMLKNTFPKVFLSALANPSVTPTSLTGQ